MKTSKYSLFRVLAAACILLALQPGCRRKTPGNAEEETKQPGEPAYIIDKDYERGPLTFNMKVDKTDITIAEEINLILEVTAQKDYMVAFPEMTGQLGQFSIKDHLVQPSKAVDKDKIRMVQNYVLEPFLSGDYKIPPLAFKYWPGTGTGENAHLLETEEVPVKVKSLLPEDKEKLALKGLAGPVEPPRPDITWIILLGCGILVLLGGGTFLIIWMIKRREKMITALYIPAHEIAFRQLRALVALKHIDNGQYKLFYGGISNILRHYVENRFGLHAPERTTEEFLIDLQESAVLDTGQKNTLREFLKHCDLVKFAELVPAEAEIQQTFDLCKNFILQTQDQAARIEDTGDHNPYLAGQEAATAGNTADRPPDLNMDLNKDTDNDQI